VTQDERPGAWKRDRPSSFGADRHSKGRAAEEAVVALLRRDGYSIVATNLRLGALELDIVARRGPLIAIVEVRTRGAGAWTSGFGSVDWKKRRRVRRAGERLWQRRYRNDSTVERMRFDVASVQWSASGNAEIDYSIAAF
jgi:putative endonuclease